MMTIRILPHVVRSPVQAAMLLLASLLLTGAGCVAPDADDATAPAATAETIRQDLERDRAAIPTPANAPRTAPPMSDPLPPLRAPERDPQRALRPGTVRTPVVVDTSCTRDADCTIKNVGNCCGEYPACVNVDSPTDPAAVQAQCVREGLMSVCGFPSISACTCVAGQCQGNSAAVEQ